MGGVRLYLRRTECWDKISPEQHIKNLRKNPNLSFLTKEQFEILTNNLNYWNKHCKKSFVKYRAELFEVAKNSWNAAGLEQNIIGLAPTLPTDDDDIFHPDIQDALFDCFSGKIKGVYWQSWVFNLGKSKIFQATKKVFSVFNKDNFYPASNGYCLLSDLNKNLHQLQHHRLAFDKIIKEEILYIDKPLSVWIKTPASSWEMMTMKQSNFEINYIETIPAEIRWAESKIRQIYELTMDMIPDVTP